MDEDTDIIREEVSLIMAFRSPGVCRNIANFRSRLWHNLTVVLTEFVSNPESGPYQIDLFQK